MLRLFIVLFLIIPTMVSAQSLSESQLKKLNDKDFFWLKKLEKLSKNAEKNRSIILKEFIDRINKFEIENGRLKLIKWPKDQSLIQKYILEILKDERS